MTDLSTLLTEDVIEAAARAVSEFEYGHGRVSLWEDYENLARAALSAALPMIVEKMGKL
jgi:hypothetical protein